MLYKTGILEFEYKGQKLFGCVYYSKRFFKAELRKVNVSVSKNIEYFWTCKETPIVFVESNVIKKEILKYLKNGGTIND